MDRCTVKDAQLEGQNVQGGEDASLARGVVIKIVISSAKCFGYQYEGIIA